MYCIGNWMVGWDKISTKSCKKKRKRKLKSIQLSLYIAKQVKQVYFVIKGFRLYKFLIIVIYKYI